MKKEELAIKLIDALTIKERKAVLKDKKSNNDNIKLWTSIRSRVSNDLFRKKMELEGYNAEEFNNSIQNIEINIDLKNALMPVVLESDWFNAFLEIVDCFEQGDRKRMSEDSVDMSFCNHIFIHWAEKQLNTFIKTLHHITISREVMIEVCTNLNAELINQSAKTIVYEFNETKKNEGLLIKEFVQKNFSDIDSIIKFYSKYPVLLRRLVTKTIFLVKHYKKMFSNIDENFDAIEKSMDIKLGSNLTHLSCGVGDSHVEGKSVAILSFDEKKVVYKPRNVEVQKQYNEFLKWFNEKSKVLPFYITKDYYGEDFAVTQFVDYKECQNEHEVKRFYTRVGQTLSILYILFGIDMHYENIIAQGEFPVIIDHETFFNNSSINDEHIATSAYEKANKYLAYSILNTGILPINIAGVDLGALAGKKSETRKFWQLVDFNKENMRFEYKPGHVDDKNNIPKLNDVVVSYKDYLNEIIEGFKITFRFFINHKEETFKEIEKFSPYTVRILMQPTQSYADLFQFASHPKYTSDMLNMEKLFENFWANNHQDKRATVYEIMDAHNCDFPIFFTKCNSRDLYTSNGEKIKDFFEKSGIENVEARMQSLEEEYIKQVQVLEMMLRDYEEKNSEHNVICTQRRKLVDKKFNQDNEQSLFNMINNEIIKRAIMGNDETVTMLAIFDHTIKGIDISYYDGLSGIGTYISSALSYDELKIEDGVRSALEEIRNRIVKMSCEDQPYAYPESLSAYKGGISYFKFLVDEYERTKAIDLREQINITIEIFNKLIPMRLKIMSVGDVASCIEVLIRYYEISFDYVALLAAINISDMLLHKIRLNGINNSLWDDVVSAGDLLWVFYKLKEHTDENIYEEYYNYLKNAIKDVLLVEEDKEVYLNKLYKEGHLQRLGEKLIIISNSDTKEDFTQEIQIITDLVCKGDCDNDSLLNGLACDINYLITLTQYMDNQTINEIKTKKYHELISGFAVNNSVRIKNYPYYINLGLIDGISGIGYVLMRYHVSTINSPII